MKKNNFFNLKFPDKILGVDRSLLSLFLPLFGLFILFLISLNLVLIPKKTEIDNVAAKIADTKANTNKIKEQNRYLMSVDQEALKKDADYLDNAVLKDKRSYLLVEIIRRVANNYNFQVESFSLNPGELKGEDDSSVKVSKTGETIKMPVTLSLVGPQEKSLELIMALEKTLPILFIDSFENKKSGSMSQLDLVISSYYLNDKVSTEITNVSLEDLKLSKEESDLISRISSFTKLEDNAGEGGSSEFKQYERENPFSL